MILWTYTLDLYLSVVNTLSIYSVFPIKCTLCKIKANFLFSLFIHLQTQIFTLITDITLFFRFDKVFLVNNSKYWRPLENLRRMLFFKKSCFSPSFISFRFYRFRFWIHRVKLSLEILPRGFSYITPSLWKLTDFSLFRR